MIYSFLSCSFGESAYMRQIRVSGRKLYQVPRLNPLEAIMKDCRDYFQETNRRVSFEYALLGVWDLR